MSPWHAESFLWALIATCLFVLPGECFSWGLSRQSPDSRLQGAGRLRQYQVPSPPASNSQLSKSYALALDELQELESEPLCHRIAAKHLVSNCQLLDGKDEATVHTDTGRATRDFVDSYAASLAICDLERGSFTIPSSCSKFRESTLATLTAPTTPQLHVSTYEIDSCLEGLAQSDSAWNTWISYRHKALRFCEAARMEHEKDQTIHLHRRVAHILAKLTTEIESEMSMRFEAMNHAFGHVSQSLDSLGPKIGGLHSQLDVLRGLMGDDMLHTVQLSSEAIREGLDDAHNLRQLLLVLIKSTMDHSADVAASHETAMQSAAARMDNTLQTVMAAITAAFESSMILQVQIDTSSEKTVSLQQKQEKLEMGMERLRDLAEGLAIQYDTHEGRLERAQQQAETILGTLDTISVSATTFKDSIFANSGFKGWWPCILFPILSLLLGSYGLEPSMGRNLWLVSLGEIAGFLVSNAGRYVSSLFAPVKIPLQQAGMLNTTTSVEFLPHQIPPSIKLQPRGDAYDRY